MNKFIKHEFDKQFIENLRDEYKYFVYARDNFLSKWGCAENKTHVQIILCRDDEETVDILKRLTNDKTFSYVNWHILDYPTLCKTVKNKSFSIRNDFIND